MKLDSCLAEQNFKGHHYIGGDVVQGDPREDGAVELLIRHGLPDETPLALINFGCGAWKNLGKALAMHVFIEDHLACEKNQLKSVIATPATLGSQLAKFGGAVLRVFRDMAFNWNWIDALLKALPAGATLHVIGEKDDGILSIDKRLNGRGFEVRSVAVGCHSRWISIVVPASLPASSAGSPVKELISIKTPQGVFPMWIPEGVFASGHLDTGSALLLEHIGDMKGLAVWDVGCGAGVIARAALEAGAIRVYASDHSALAIEASSQNLAAFQDRAKTGLHFLGDGVPGVYDRILSNPPFHLEGRELREFGRVWLMACKEHLAPGGQIRLVCNAFLPYAQFAQELGMQATELAHSGGFKVWQLKMR